MLRIVASGVLGGIFGHLIHKTYGDDLSMVIALGLLWLICHTIVVFDP